MLGAFYAGIYLGCHLICVCTHYIIIAPSPHPKWPQATVISSRQVDFKAVPPQVRITRTDLKRSWHPGEEESLNKYIYTFEAKWSQWLCNFYRFPCGTSYLKKVLPIHYAITCIIFALTHPELYVVRCIAILEFIELKFGVKYFRSSHIVMRCTIMNRHHVWKFRLNNFSENTPDFFLF